MILLKSYWRDCPLYLPKFSRAVCDLSVLITFVIILLLITSEDWLPWTLRELSSVLTIVYLTNSLARLNAAAWGAGST